MGRRPLGRTDGVARSAGWRCARRKGEGESLAYVRGGKERVGGLEDGEAGLIVIIATALR